MLGIIAKGGVFLVGATATIIGGNYYFVNSEWQKNHALIKESVALLQKDRKIRKILGPNLDYKRSVMGTLEPGKNWASFAFTITGDEGEAKVHILAEAKEDSKQEDQYPVAEFKYPNSTFDYMKSFFLMKEMDNSKLH